MHKLLLLMFAIFLSTTAGPFYDSKDIVGLGESCNASNWRQCKNGFCHGGVCCHEGAGICESDSHCCYNKDFPELYKCVNGFCSSCTGRREACYTRSSEGRCLCCGQGVLSNYREYCPDFEKGTPCDFLNQHFCISGVCGYNGYCE